MKQGVKGRDLGIAIKKIEAEKFKKLMEMQ
jgi:hypothetical protein